MVCAGPFGAIACMHRASFAQEHKDAALFTELFWRYSENRVHYIPFKRFLKRFSAPLFRLGAKFFLQHKTGLFHSNLPFGSSLVKSMVQCMDFRCSQEPSLYRILPERWSGAGWRNAFPAEKKAHIHLISPTLHTIRVEKTLIEYFSSRPGAKRKGDSSELLSPFLYSLIM